MIRIIDPLTGNHLFWQGSMSNFGTLGLVPFVTASGTYGYGPYHELVTPGTFTVGCWLKTAGNGHIVGTWAPANQVWRLHMSGSKPSLSLSSTGANETLLQADNTIGNVWTFIVGRYTGGSEMAIWVNDVKKTTAAGVPATPYAASTTLFTVGIQGNSANALGGSMALMFFSNLAIPDVHIAALFSVGRILFKV